MATTIWYSNPTSGNAMNFTDTNQWNTATDGSGTAGNPDSTDDKAVIQSGDTVTLDADVTVGQCFVQGTLTGNTSFSLTLAGSDEDNNFSNNGTVTNLNIIMTGIRASGDRSIIDSGSGIRDLTINDTTNSGNNVHKLGGNLTIDGNLTITSGTLSTVTPAGSSVGLTVAGHVSVDGTLTGNASAISVGSMIVNSGGTYSATSGTTTVTSENASHAFRVSGGGTYTNNNGTLEIQTAAQTRLKMNGTGNVHHLTVNHASCQLHMESDSSTTVEGNLTITAGIVRTFTEGNSQRTLIVAGTTTIGPNSGAADQATLTCSDSTISLGSGITSSAYGLYVNQGGTFTGGSGTHTLGSVVVRNNAAAKCTLSSGVTTINGEHGGDGRAINIEGTSATFDDGNGTVTFTFAGTTKISLAGKSLYNVIVNDSSASVEYIGDTTIDNDLTVTAGKFRYNNFHDLTVTGDVSVTGILGHPTTTTTSNSTFGSLTINSGGEYKAPSGTTTVDQGSTYVLRNLGTYTHNSGTLKVARSSASGTRFLELGSAAIHKLVIDNTATTAAVAFVGVVNCANDLEVTNGDFRAYGGSGDVTIDGDVTISNSSFFRTQTTQLAAGGVNASLGSLTINSGATYDATPLTTTITGANSNNFALEGAGTFTHNNGTLEFSNAGYRMPKSGTFNNVTVNGISSTGGIHCMSHSMLPHGVMPDGTSDNETMSILGKLHIKNDDFRPYQVGDIFIHHLEIGDGTGSAETALFGMNADDVFDGKVVVDNVTIHSDGKLRFGDGDETSTTVGSSAMEVRGAFRNIGGSIDIV